MSASSKPDSAVPSYRPLYLQIKDLMTARLAAGEWPPGKTLPSELALAAELGVSQGTVRKAMDELAADNLVVRRQGKGTYAVTHTEEAQSMFRFLRIRCDDGVAEYPRSRLIDFKRGRATSEVARMLELRTGDPIVSIRRVLEWKGEPVLLDDLTLPAVLFRGLTRAKLEAYTGSMYGLFETRFGIRMLSAQERLKAVAADATSAAILGVTPGSPLLSVDRIAFTFGERPVEYRRGLCTTFDHYYANTLG